jgi:hypothetical protein
LTLNSAVVGKKNTCWSVPDTTSPISDTGPRRVIAYAPQRSARVIGKLMVAGAHSS